MMIVQLLDIYCGECAREKFGNIFQYLNLGIFYY